MGLLDKIPEKNDYEVYEENNFNTCGTLIVEKKLEEKIRTLCALYPSNEWSGALFYTVKGDLLRGITIYASDMFLMNIGSHTYTAFKTDDSVKLVQYMSANGLFGHNIGLIHSHNSFSAFFSGTDTGTLNSEGKEMPNFVSLIVNNAGQYVAAITNRVLNVIKQYITPSYTLFGGRKRKMKPMKKVIEEYSVEIFDLNVVIEPAEASPLSLQIHDCSDSTVSATSYPSYDYKNRYDSKEEKEEEKEEGEKVESKLWYGDIDWDDRNADLEF